MTFIKNIGFLIEQIVVTTLQMLQFTAHGLGLTKKNPFK